MPEATISFLDKNGRIDPLRITYGQLEEIIPALPAGIAHDATAIINGPRKGRVEYVPPTWLQVLRAAHLVYVQTRQKLGYSVEPGTPWNEPSRDIQQRLQTLSEATANESAPDGFEYVKLSEADKITDEPSMPDRILFSCYVNTTSFSRVALVTYPASRSLKQGDMLAAVRGDEPQTIFEPDDKEKPENERRAVADWESIIGVYTVLEIRDRIVIAEYAGEKNRFPAWLFGGPQLKFGTRFVPVTAEEAVTGGIFTPL